MFFKNKTKQKPANKQKYKNHGICFVLADYSWAWSLPWSVADIPGDTPLEKTDFPFPAGIDCKQCLG